MLEFVSAGDLGSAGMILITQLFDKVNLGGGEIYTYVCV